MRILNRPMFKYGGPIKEGVMHGMRNNYQSGQLVRPGPGRPGYQGPDGYWKNLIKAATRFYNPAGKPGKIIKAVKNIPQVVKGIPKNLQGIFTQTGKTSGITGSPAATTFMQNLRSFPGASKIGGWATKAKDLAIKYPKSTALTALYGGVPLATNLPYKKIASTIADIAVPDQIYNWETGRWFNSDDTDLKPSDKKILEQKKTEAIGPGAQFEHTAPILTESQRTKLAKDQQNTRLKSYLDMMGYDQAKKGALSKALIDASAVVQQGTEEAGSLKEADWGSLINKIIQTTSRRLEKPEQIREAVGLMMTKGAIEKDIAEGKGGQLKQNARDMVAAGVYKTEKEAMEHLGKKVGFEEVVGALSAKKDVTGKVLADAWRISGEGIPTESFRGSDDVYKNFKEKKEDAGKGTNIELAFVEEEIDDKKPGDVYIVDDRLIIVQKDGTLKYRW
jgi:hypothetical protein